LSVHARVNRSVASEARSCPIPAFARACWVVPRGDDGLQRRDGGLWDLGNGRDAGGTRGRARVATASSASQISTWSSSASSALCR
jgi:hypothetical protein